MEMLHLLEDCQLWKDFPKGLHVLVVDKDAQALNDIKAKLEECKYEVTAFERSEDAVSALESPRSPFHVALVEAEIGEELDGFCILSAKKHNNIPTIIMSDKENREVMLRAFALGAVEFLQKPLSDEKLKNVWQHAVRKALVRGEKTLPQSSKLFDTTPIDSSSSDQIADDEEVVSEDKEDAGFLIEGEPHEKISAPSTPKLEHTDILNCREENDAEDSSSSETLTPSVKIQSDDNHYSDGGSSCTTLSEVKKESLCCELQTSTESAAHGELNYFDKMEMDFDDFCLGDRDLNLSDLEIDSDMLADFSLQNHGDLDMDLYCLDHCEVLEKDLAEEEALLLAEVSKAEKEQQIASIPDYTTNSSDSSDVKDEVLSDEKKTKGTECVKTATKNHHGKRKVKVDWTPDLHRRFVQAVEQLGIDKAVPSRILELMGVNCLTRHNIASHLQKYRSHRKHLLAREAEAASWNHKRQIYAAPGTRSRREVSPWTANSGNTLIQPRPAIVYPPATPPPPPFRPLHVWGHPTVDHSMVHMWHKQSLPPPLWPAADGTFWQHYQACTDTWGHNAPAPGTPCYPHPLMRLPVGPVAGIPHFNPPVFNGDHYRPEDSSPVYPVQIDVKPETLHPPKETVNAAINEVLSNPWTPLPIGLNPPSLESVMTALQRKGISNVPLASACLAR